MADLKKVTSVAVGSSQTNWGGGSGKAKARHGTLPSFDVKRNQGSSGSNKNKLPSGTYKA